MKKLLLIWIFSGSLDGFSQDGGSSKIAPVAIERYIVVQTSPGVYSAVQVPLEAKPDTIPEWMHVSATRTKGFVIARKALSVRVNGYCVTHLDCDKKPFPVHYHVGWCQGKDELLTALLNERRAKQ